MSAELYTHVAIRILDEERTKKPCMCMELFVASDVPLPLIAYDPAKAIFSTRSLPADSEPVLRLFSKPYVYDLGSVEGCACGFVYGPWDLEVLTDAGMPSEIKKSVSADYEARRESVCLLKEHLRVAVGSGTAEVYSCWIGDEGADPETRLDVTLDHFGGDDFNLVQKQFLTVRSASDA